MTKSSRVAVLALVLGAGSAPVSVSAQEYPAGGSTADPAVRAVVADRWGVAPEQVVLEWGASRDFTPVADALVDLRGTGGGGHWIARFEAPGDDIVSVRLRAGRSTSRPVASKRLARGSVIAETDITWATDVEWGPPGPARVDALVGWVAQRTIDKGAPLAEPAVRAPRAVTSGSSILVVWKSGPLSLEVPGSAAGTGALGDEIYVRTASGERLKGVIVAPGVVDVTLSAVRNQRGGEQ